MSLAATAPAPASGAGLRHAVGVALAGVGLFLVLVLGLVCVTCSVAGEAHDGVRAASTTVLVTAGAAVATRRRVGLPRRPRASSTATLIAHHAGLRPTEVGRHDRRRRGPPALHL